MCAIFVVLAAVLVCDVSADLPVHCLHKQILGEWSFHRSKGGNPKSFADGCSKGAKTAYLGGGDFGLGEASYHVHDTVKVNLESPNKASAVVNGKKVTGTWTMMYDEGFEVVLGDEKYFAFSKYTGTVKHATSHCGETFPGWYHADPDKESWGCYHATKNSHVAPQKYRKFGEGKKLGFIRNSDGDLIAPGADAKRKVARHAMPTADQDAGGDDAMLVQVDAEAETEAESLSESRDFYEDQTDLVSAVNKGHKAGAHTWHATHYAPRAIKRMGTVKAHYKGLGESEMLETAPFRKAAASKVDDHDIPEHFDWASVNGKNYVPPVMDQKCGSCYAFATRDMMEARLRVLTKNSDKKSMSVQSVLSCNRYSQGCKGGFPYTVAKFFQDNGAMREADQPSKKDSHHRGEKKPRNKAAALAAAPDKVKCNKKAAPVARAWTYKYVGGFYGATNEKSMRRDIFDHGPLAVCFQVGLGFGNYKGGIFRQEARLPRQNHWDRVNHAVLITGWGHDNGHKYWKVKNSWGPQWGDKGYFKIERGSNQLNIESDAVALYPSKGESLRSSTRMSLRSSMGSEMLLEAAAAKVLTTTAEESLLQVEEDAEEPAWITGEDDNRDEE
jgi:cathepsin C